MARHCPWRVRQRVLAVSRLTPLAFNDGSAAAALAAICVNSAKSQIGLPAPLGGSPVASSKTHFADRSYEGVKRLDSGVSEHKFKIGQLVYFHPEGVGRVDAVPGPYQITRRLPAAEDGEFQYEIRSRFEDHGRVARESELTRT
jgi:hypothetical protein